MSINMPKKHYIDLLGPCNKLTLLHHSRYIPEGEVLSKPPFYGGVMQWSKIQRGLHLSKADSKGGYVTSVLNIPVNLLRETLLKIKYVRGGISKDINKTAHSYSFIFEVVGYNANRNTETQTVN